MYQTIFNTLESTENRIFLQLPWWNSSSWINWYPNIAKNTATNDRGLGNRFGFRHPSAYINQFLIGRDPRCHRNSENESQSQAAIENDVGPWTCMANDLGGKSTSNQLITHHKPCILNEIWCASSLLISTTKKYMITPRKSGFGKQTVG
jgi:hypothetical protein